MQKNINRHKNKKSGKAAKSKKKVEHPKKSERKKMFYLLPHRWHIIGKLFNLPTRISYFLKLKIKLKTNLI